LSSARDPSRRSGETRPLQLPQPGRFFLDDDRHFQYAQFSFLLPPADVVPKTSLSFSLRGQARPPSSSICFCASSSCDLFQIHDEFSQGPLPIDPPRCWRGSAIFFFFFFFFFGFFDEQRGPPSESLPHPILSVFSLLFCPSYLKTSAPRALFSPFFCQALLDSRAVFPLVGPPPTLIFLR